MNMILKRLYRRADGIFGELLDSGGNHFCYTLEHSYGDTEVGGLYAPKIPSLTYTCLRRKSPRFGYDVFELLNVPGCNFIEIHKGNYNKDSEGCILLGTDIAKPEPGHGDWMLTDSSTMFNKFMELQSGDEFTLTVE